MKTCNNCGTSANDNAAACPNCGSSFPTYYPTPPVYKEPVSVGGWIGRSLIPLIPVIGSLVYLIMLFIWSGDATKEDTFRNWAKAQLIVTGIVIVLVVLLIVLAVALSAPA